MPSKLIGYEIPELDYTEFEFEVHYEVIPPQDDVGLPNGDIEIQSIVCSNDLVQKMIKSGDIESETMRIDFDVNIADEVL